MYFIYSSIIVAIFKAYHWIPLQKLSQQKFISLTLDEFACTHSCEICDHFRKGSVPTYGLIDGE